MTGLDFADCQRYMLVPSERAAARTALLRTALRMTAASAAVLDAGAEIVAEGLDDADTAALAAALRDGGTLPDGWVRIERLPIAHNGGGLSLLDRVPRTIEPGLRPALDALVAELGEIVAAQTVAPDVLDTDARLRNVADGIDSINDAAAIYEWPRAGRVPRIIYANSAFGKLFGCDPDDTSGETAEFLYGPLTDLDRLEYMHDRVRETRSACNTVVYYRGDGTPIWIELSLHAVSGLAESTPCMVATLRDVTMRKEFEAAIAREKRKLQVTLAAIGDGVITTVLDGRVDFVNSAAKSLFGIDAAEAYGQPISALIRLADPHGSAVDVLRSGEENGGVARGQALYERSGIVKHISYVRSRIGDEGYVIVLRDVTAAHRLATQLTYEASHDSLTGIYNRRKFDELMDDAIESALRSEGPHAVAFLDLDRFKFINDTCGHANGDRVLLDIAHLLQHQLRGRDVVARLGGDEFAVLLHECGLENARRVLEKLRRSVESYRLSHNGQEHSVGVSIGVAAIDGSLTDASAILRIADDACYDAKNRGRNAIAG